MTVVGDDVDRHEALDANHATNRDDGLLGRADGQDRGLVRWENGVELVDAEHAEVGDGEVTAGVVSRGQASAARLLHEPAPFAAELVDIGVGGVVQDWRDQTIIERNGDGDVHLVVVHDALTVVVGGVHDRVLRERDADSLGEQGGHRHTLRLESGVQLVELVGADAHRDAGDRN